MEGNIRIAVIVPIYNCEKFLADCLDSLISQTYKDWEAYCVNDGSIDNSGEILDQYAAKDSRIIALHKKNGGEHSARNYALDRIRAADNKWIAFVDGDDYISPFMFEHLAYIVKSVSNPEFQYARLYSQRTPLDISDNHIYRDLLNKSKESYSLSEEECIYRLFDNDGYFKDGHCGGQISSAFIHSKLIDKYHYRGPEEMKLMGDQVFTMKCAMKSPLIVEYRVQDYFYRFNPHSVISTTKDASEFIIRCLNYVYEAMKEDGLTEARHNYLENEYIPIKVKFLIASRFKSGGSAPLPPLNKDIEIHNYIYGWKYKLAYFYLRIRRRL